MKLKNTPSFAFRDYRIAIVIGYAAIRVRARPNSERHRFGFKRAEAFAAVMAKLSIIVMKRCAPVTFSNSC